MGTLLSLLAAAALSFGGAAVNRQLSEQSAAAATRDFTTTGLITITETAGDSVKAVHTHNPFGGGDYYLKKLTGKSEVAVHIDFPPGHDDTNINENTMFEITIGKKLIAYGSLSLNFDQLDVAKHKGSRESDIFVRKVAWNKKGIGFKFTEYFDSSKLYADHDSTAHLDGDLPRFFQLLTEYYQTHKTNDGTQTVDAKLSLDGFTANVKLTYKFDVKSKIYDDKEVGKKEGTSVKITGSGTNK